jgi:hypothetical protein
VKESGEAFLALPFREIDLWEFVSGFAAGPSRAFGHPSRTMQSQFWRDSHKVRALPGLEAALDKPVKAGYNAWRLVTAICGQRALSSSLFFSCALSSEVINGYL